MTAAGGLVQPGLPAVVLDYRDGSCGPLGLGGVAVGGAQRPQDLPYPALAGPDQAGDVGDGEALAALGLPQPPELGDALGAGESAASERGQGAAHIVLAHPNLLGDRGRVERLTLGDLAGLVDLLDPLQCQSRRRTLVGLGPAAVSVGGLQRDQLLAGWVAVADRLSPQASQARVGLVAGPQGVQPLAGNRGGGPDLGREYLRVEPLTTGQLSGQVGVGDLIAHQPHPQLRQRRVVLAVGAQHSHQVTGERGRHTDLAGEGGRVGRLAAVDLTSQPGIGDPLPGRARVGWPLLLRLAAGGHAGRAQVEGHRRPPSRSGQTTLAAAARPWVRSWRRWMRLKARSVLRPRRRSTLSARRAARPSARSLLARSLGA